MQQQESKHAVPAANKGHMAASCTVPKSQLKCKFCESQNSHNTAACLKKKKADKKKDDEKGGKTDKTDSTVKKNLLKKGGTTLLPIKEISLSQEAIDPLLDSEHLVLR